MKNLLYKEFRLVVNPMYYLVSLTAALLLIPQWPYFIAMMYLFFITVPNLFTGSKSQNDIGFTVMLPVRKGDVVRARILTIVALELIQLAASVVFAVLNVSLYRTENFLLDPNIAFFGLSFVMYGLFNVIYFPMFYKTPYKTGFPTTIAVIATILFAGAVETAVLLLPRVKHILDGISGDALIRQLPVLAGGIAVFALLTWLASRASVKRFEKVDL